MDDKYIIAICAGGVYTFLFLIYIIRLYNKHQIKKRQKREQQLAYSDRNLKKIEYDLACYHPMQLSKIGEPLSEEDVQALLKQTEQSLYEKPIADTQKPIEGHYKP